MSAWRPAALIFLALAVLAVFVVLGLLIANDARLARPGVPAQTPPTPTPAAEREELSWTAGQAPVPVMDTEQPPVRPAALEIAASGADWLSLGDLNADGHSLAGQRAGRH
jgi:uncharacterized iron-regulated membrane protein